MTRPGRFPYKPAEDQAKDEAEAQSPAEFFLRADRPEAFAEPLTGPGPLGDPEPVFPPWEPTGDESPKKTIEAAEDLRDTSAPPPETAGGSIPAAYAQFRKYGPDEA